MRKLLPILMLAFFACRKEPMCEKITGDLLIRNTTEHRQRVSIDASIVVMMDAKSRLTIHDLTKGNHEVKAMDFETGASAFVFVEVRPCEESEIVI